MRKSTAPTGDFLGVWIDFLGVWIPVVSIRSASDRLETQRLDAEVDCSNR